MGIAAPARLLLTRPAPDSRRIAAMLPAIETEISPILRITPVAHDGARLRAARGLVFTSVHAVDAAGPGRGRFAICVGGRTGQVARAAGFAVREGQGTADSLLPLIAAAPVPLIHPHGRHLARKLPVEGMVVYDQIGQPLSARAQQWLAEGRPVLVPLFSPRSARLISAQLRGAAAPLWPVAISPAAMAQWSAPFAGHAVARAPSAEAMVLAISHLMADA